MHNSLDESIRMGSIRSRPCRHRHRRVSFQHERIIINVRSERNKRYQYNIRYSVININNVFWKRGA